MYYPIVLFFLLLILQVEFDRKAAHVLRWPKRIASHFAFFVIVGFIFWVVHLWYMRDYASRAYINIDTITMDRGTPFPTFEIQGHTGGKDIDLAILRAVLTTGVWGHPGEERKVREKLNWQINGNTLVFGRELNGGIIHPETPFHLRVEYGATLDELRDIGDGTTYLIMFTTSCTKDKWGETPSVNTCSWFSSRSGFQRGECHDNGNPPPNWRDWVFEPPCVLK